MGQFFYVDVYKQIESAKNSDIFNNMQFIVFGGFDGMYVEPMGKQSLSRLKQTYERRHEGLENNTDPTCFLATDRQPMFLYSPHDKDMLSTIFSRTDRYRTYPLVLTLFQLDKTTIKHPTLECLLNKCQSSIEESINECLSRNRSCLDSFCSNNYCDICYEIFWNLGAADVAVVFRAKCLLCVAKLLEIIRHSKLLADVPIKSTSSYNGFPRTDEWEQRIEEWLHSESSVSAFSLNTFYDVPAGVKTNNNDSLFMFGEWDFLRCWNSASDNVDSAKSMLKEVIEHNWTANSTGTARNYRSIYTMPAFVLNANTDNGDNTTYLSQIIALLRLSPVS